MKRYILGNNNMWFILTIVFKTLQTIAALGVAVILSILIDTINQQKIDSFYQMLILSVGYAIVVGLITWISMRVEAKFRKNALFNIRKDLMNGVLNQNIVEFQKENSAKYISLFNNNLTVVEENYIKNIISVFGSITMIIFAVIILIALNWLVAIVAILFSIIPAVIPQLFGKKLGKAQQDIALSSSNYNGNIKDIFNGFDVIKSYTIEERVKKEHDFYAQEVECKKCKSATLMGDLYGITNFASISVQFIIILFAGVLAAKGYITLGNIIAITQLSGQAITPAFELSSKFGLLKSVKEINKEIINFIDLKREESVSSNIGLNKMITMKNVSFSYEDREVLKNIDFDIMKNKKYAIVGSSGCGKSTLVKLMLHYYDNYSGDILIDDINYNSISAEDVNKLCSFLQQSVFLFDDTIKNNITLFENIEIGKLNDAIHKAGLEQMIDKLKNGLDTQVGECGNMLSGGEQQRIAIARSLLKGSNVLILDEATSALDNETATYIENTVLQMINITSVIITHRLSETTLKQYDEIVVMDDGHIVDNGKFEYLIQNCQQFKKLFYASM
ncbi:MAG: ABC transporter ATP-binding protein [Longicatena sp.]